MANIVAVRDDGFCQRLKIMLKALRISAINNIHMKFIWNGKKGLYGSFHSCGDVGEIFSKDFIDRCYIKEKPMNGVLLNGKKGVYKDNLDYVLTSDVDLAGGAYNAEFDKIGFSGGMKNARSLADNVNVDGVYAIHVRGGDVVYGPLKKYSLIHQDKVFPISVVKKLIITSNKKWIVFAQDESVKEELRNFDNVLISSDLGPSFVTNAEALMFDMVLMSRCERIYGGSSAVCEVASLLSGKDIYGLNDIYSNFEICGCIINDKGFIDKNYDNFTLSFLGASIYYYSNNNDEKISALKGAIEQDPNNHGLKIILLYTLFDRGDWDNAEILAQKLILSFSRSGSLNNLFRDVHAFMSRKFVRSRILLNDVVDHDRFYEYPFLDAMVIFVSYYFGNKINIVDAGDWTSSESLVPFFLALKGYLGKYMINK